MHVNDRFDVVDDDDADDDVGGAVCGVAKCVSNVWMRMPFARMGCEMDFLRGFPTNSFVNLNSSSSQMSLPDKKL